MVKKNKKKEGTRSRQRPSAPSTWYRAIPNEYTLERRAEKLAQVIKLYPNEVARGLAERPDAGWHFGRLYLVGAIDGVQRDAARKLDRVAREYQKTLHRYSSLRALDPMKVGGHSAEDLSPAAEKRFLRIKEQYDWMLERLTKQGEDVKTAVMDALKKDEVTDLALIRKGLDALSKL